MLGFSIDLGQELTADTHNYLLKMRNAGFEGVFVSLQIPENSEKVVLQNFAELKKWCHDLGLLLVGDLSKKGLARLGYSANLASLIDLGLSGIRIDAGFTNDEIAKISQKLHVALNASTLTEADILELKEDNADFDHLEAWHNYYPRPNTGLDENWFKRRNSWLKEYGLTVMAFVSGDSTLRGPIYQGLPTLEKHRAKSSFYAALDLFEMGVDRVYIGDCALSEASLKQFIAYFKQHYLLLFTNQKIKALEGQIWHQRPDLSQDVIRLTEGRTLKPFAGYELPTLARKQGTITSDNAKYLRYEGELEITKTDLPADEKVGVAGQILERDFPLLKLIKPGEAIKFEQLV